MTHVACVVALLSCVGALRKSQKLSEGLSDERAALARGLDYFASGLDGDSKAYLNGTQASASTWRHGPTWKNTFVGALQKLGRTGVEVDDHDGTPIGNGESIGLVSAKLIFDKAQIDKLPRAFQTGIFGFCNTACPQLQAAIRFSHTNAADHDLMRVALKLHTTKYGEVDFHFTETLEGFPIKDIEQLEAFSYMEEHGAAWALVRYPLSLARMGSQQSSLASRYGPDSFKAGALGKTYYSMIPFRLGVRGSSAGAFKVRLVAQQSQRHPGGGAKQPKQEYLKGMREYLVRHVNARGTSFSFEIQVATNAKQHSLMDAYTVWNETSAPWVRMGTVRIPQQEFVSPVTVGSVVGSGLWVKGRAAFNSKELAFLPGGEPHPPVGDIGHFRSFLYPPYDKERQEVLLGKPGGIPAKCPLR